MLFQFFSYLKFLISSTNQHGIHSPFVYSFVTKGLYKKQCENNFSKTYHQLKKLTNKEQKILFKIINYFQIDEIYFTQKTKTNTLDKSYKLLLINNIEYLKKIDLTNFNTTYFLVIHNIHKNKKTDTQWQEIIKTNKATVTIDLFYFGLLFFRKGQRKEHFKIRV